MMQEAYVALLIYGMWMYGLILVMLFLRVSAARAGKVTFQTVTADNRNISDFAYRLSRAHANCYENLPVFVGIVAVAGLSGQISVINGMAYIFILARILQSCVHLYSSSAKFVPIRGLLFGIQVFLQIYWSIILLSGI